MAPRVCLSILFCLAAMPAIGGESSGQAAAFRVRPYLQNPAHDAMTVRWFSQSTDPGTLTIDEKTLTSKPRRCNELEYQGPEPADLRYPSPPWLHSIRVTGLEPSTSYPYTVEQNGETISAILTTSPRPGDVGKGGGVRLFVYADSEVEPESRECRSDWPASLSMPGEPRPRWVRGQYLTDESTGYRMNLALIASRAAESLRAGNPVVASVAGGLVANGGEQRDWDEFWRYNAGIFGGLASRVPIVAAFGDNEICGGPPSADLLADLGGFSGPASLLASRKFLTYFEHPDNRATEKRHVGRYHRLNFGPITLLTIDATNSGDDGTDGDTNHVLDRVKAPHIPDCGPGSEQHAWLERQLTDARRRQAITFVQMHHAPFSAGLHGRPPGKGPAQDEHSGHPLRALAALFQKYDVRAVFSGHDGMYEHSLVDGVHYYDVGIGGSSLRGPQNDVINDRQIFIAHDHAAEHWNGDLLEKGGKHYGHLEVDVRRTSASTGNAGGGDAGGGSSATFAVTITPVHVFPVLDPEHPGEIAAWERREYDDVLTFEFDRTPAAPAAGAPSPE